MKSIASRLDRIEAELTPSNRFALCFVREACQEEDLARQREEYQELHGDDRKVCFLCIRDFSSEEAESGTYEAFLEMRRRKIAKCACFVWWSELPPLEDIPA